MLLQGQGLIYVLQWGRASMSAGKSCCSSGSPAAPSPRMLQWGRAFDGAAESDPALRVARETTRASMGPRFDERGKAGKEPICGGACAGFNGAALR